MMGFHIWFENSRSGWHNGKRFKSPEIECPEVEYTAYPHISWGILGNLVSEPHFPYRAV